MRSAFLLPLLEVACAGGLTGVREHVSRWWNGDVEPASSSRVVRIGAVLSLNRSKSDCAGRALQRGFELYFDLLNEVRGGIWIGGALHAVEVTWIDDRTGGDRIAAITRHFVDNLGIRLLLGPHSYELTAPAAEIAQRHGALLVAPGTSDVGIFRGQPLVFGTLPSPSQWLTPAIDLVRASGARSFAVFQENTPIMNQACGAMVELSSQHDLDIVLRRHVEGNTSAELLRSAVARMKEAAPDVVVGCVHSEVCHALLKTMQEQDFNPTAVIFTGCVTAPGFLGSVGAAGQYVVGTVPWASGLPLASDLTPFNASTFSERYAVDFDDQEPPYQAALAFATCEALVFAIEQAGSTDPTLVASALQRMDQQTIFGRMAFDENGQSENQAKVVQFQQSPRYLVVGPASHAEKPFRYPKPTWTAMKCFEASKYLRYGFVEDPDTGQIVCRQCPTGKVGEFLPALSYRVCNHCPAGHSVREYPDEEEETFCQVCPRGTFSKLGGSMDKCSACLGGQYQSLTGQTACDDCPPGRFAAASGSTHCAKCGEDASSPTFSSHNGTERCTSCPPHGLCEQNKDGLFTSYTNQDGYCMMIGGGDGVLHRCPHGGGKACLARARCIADPVSREPTSEGPLCGTCRAGFGRSNWLFGLCQACPSVSKSIGGLFLTLLLTDLVTGLMVLTTLLHDFSKPTHVHSAIFKQVLNYLQMTATAFAATDFTIPLGFSVQKVWKFMERFFGLSSFPVSDLSGWCMSNHLFPQVPVYQVVTVSAFFVAPAMVLLDVLLFMMASYLWQRTGRPPLNTRILKSFVTLKLYIFLPRITELSLVPFGCYFVDKSRLLMDARVDCSSDSHRVWQYVGLASFFVLPVGLPCVFFIVLRYYKIRDRLKEPEVQTMVGFLVNGLEPEMYFFECIFMLRKVLFLFLVKLPGHSEVSPTIQSFSLTFVSGLFLLLHLWFRPYDNRAYFLLDELEGASLLAVFVTLVAQIALWSTEDAMVTRLHPFYKAFCTHIVYALLVLLHTRFLCLVVWGLLRRPIIDVVFRGRPPSWLANGQVGVTAQGLQISGLSRNAQLLLESLFAELLGSYVEKGFVGYNGLRTALQRICVCANYVTKKRKYVSLDPMKQTSRFLQEKAETLPVCGKEIKTVLQRMETRFRLTRRHSLQSVSSSAEVKAMALDLGCYVHRVHSLGMEIEKLQVYCKENKEKTIGASFTVEDLYEALLVLGEDVCLEDPEVEVVQPPVGQGSPEHSSEVPLASEGFMSRSPYPSDDDDNDGGVMTHTLAEPHILAETQVLETELRVRKSECDKQRALAESAMKECQDLRDRLSKMERGSVRFPTKEYPLTPLSAEVCDDPSSLRLSKMSILEGNDATKVDPRYKLQVDLPLAGGAEMGVESSDSMKSDLVSEPLPEPFSACSAPCSPVKNASPFAGAVRGASYTAANGLDRCSASVRGTSPTAGNSLDRGSTAVGSSGWAKSPTAGSSFDRKGAAAVGTPIGRLKRSVRPPLLTSLAVQESPANAVAWERQFAKRATAPPAVKPCEVECEAPDEEVRDLVVDEAELERKRSLRDLTRRSTTPHSEAELERKRSFPDLTRRSTKEHSEVSETEEVETKETLRDFKAGGAEGIREAASKTAQERTGVEGMTFDEVEWRRPRLLPARSIKELEKADLAWERAAAAALENSTGTASSLARPEGHLEVWVPFPQMRLAGNT